MFVRSKEAEVFYLFWDRLALLIHNLHLLLHFFVILGAVVNKEVDYVKLFLQIESQVGWIFLLNFFVVVVVPSLCVVVIPVDDDLD